MAAASKVTAAILSAGLVEAFRIKHQEKRITVTGSASRRIRSDLIVWRATVRSQNPELAYGGVATEPVATEPVPTTGPSPVAAEAPASAPGETPETTAEQSSVPQS